MLLYAVLYTAVVLKIINVLYSMWCRTYSYLVPLIRNIWERVHPWIVTLALGSEGVWISPNFEASDPVVDSMYPKPFNAPATQWGKLNEPLAKLHYA